MLSATVVFVIGLAPLGAEEPVITGRVTASKVHRLIDSIGPHQAIRRLFDSGDLENAVLNGIATGGAGWLHVAERLAPESDGVAGEGLCMAIQEALPKNPQGVLTLVHRGTFAVVHACGGYGFGQIEDERPTSVLLRLVDKRVQAVRAVTDAGLATEQQACLEALGNLRSVLQRLHR